MRITRVFLWIKDPDPGDPKRPDPTGSGSATLVSFLPRLVLWFDEKAIRKFLSPKFAAEMNIVKSWTNGDSKRGLFSELQLLHPELII